LDGNGRQTADHGGLGGVFGGHQHADLALRPRAQGDGKNGAGEGQFANGDEIIKLIGLQLFARRQDA
jgi:hypothetical protein